jgi:hypothetical protein
MVKRSFRKICVIADLMADRAPLFGQTALMSKWGQRQVLRLFNGAAVVKPI